MAFNTKASICKLLEDSTSLYTSLNFYSTRHKNRSTLKKFRKLFPHEALSSSAASLITSTERFYFEQVNYQQHKQFSEDLRAVCFADFSAQNQQHFEMRTLSLIMEIGKTIKKNRKLNPVKI